MKYLALLFTVAFAASLSAQTTPGGDVLSAIQAVPPGLRSSILKISADNGTPNPPMWYLLARKDEGELVSIAVAQGQITEQKPTLNLRALVTDPSPINLDKLSIGSDGAWTAAEKYCDTKQKELGSVSYALQQKGPDAAPIWSVWCYDGRGRYIGMIELLATTGAVISSE